ncbi:MAG: VOC family protein [Pseudomonadota bacterium]
MSHGSIHWSELCCQNVDAAKAYYAQTCGWTMADMPMPTGTYTVCSLNDQPVAGIMDIAELDVPDMMPHWMTYLAVDDIDKVCADAPAGGATVMRAPFDVPGVGRIAMIKDPGGAVVGMMTPAAG